MTSTMKLDSIEDALTAVAAGECVIVVDDEDRENEGDLIMAASLATPEKMAFIVRHTGGVVCAPITTAEARRLKLDPMVAVNDAPLSTAFTVTIDYREGLTTGISAAERCATVRALTNGNVQAQDFVRPGHIFPLVARDGGVLMRSGHTEAAVDLARLAGLPPVGVISELVNDDGSMMRGPQLADFARTHGLKLVSIADLIAYRQRRETLVRRLAQFEIMTEAGPAKASVYGTPFDSAEHLALVVGDVCASGPAPLVRLHRENPLEDVFGGQSRSLGLAMTRIKAEGRGVIVYLRDRATGVRPAALSPRGAGAEAEREDNWKEVGLGAQILRDLGLKRIRLLTSRERQYVGLAGFGVEIEGLELLKA